LSHTTTRVHHPAYGVVVAEASADGVEVLYRYDDMSRLSGSRCQVLSGATVLEELALPGAPPLPARSGPQRGSRLRALALAQARPLA
jgi:hypothetical protein